MAKKQIFLSDRLVGKHPALRKVSWAVEVFFLKSLVTVIRSLSLERAARFCHFVFRHLAPILPFTVKIQDNLRIAFPQKNAHEIKRLARQTCGNLGIAAVELVMSERLWAEREQRIEFVMEEGVDLADYRGRPVVLATGHIGAWQMGTFVGEQYGLSITLVFAPEENPKLRTYIAGLRETLPCEWASRDGCMRVLTKVLRQGNAVGLASDTRMDSGALLPFFGVSTPSNTSAARLALRHKCDLIAVRAERLPGMKFRITVCKPIRPDDPDAPAADQAGEMTQKLLGHFEAWIREDPDQWMCFGRRWPLETYTDVSMISAGDQLKN
jgi:KDO2-lipid IV(A) lauroyltransferase